MEFCHKNWPCRGPYTGDFPEIFRPAHQGIQLSLQSIRLGGGVVFPGGAYLLTALVLIFSRLRKFVYGVFVMRFILALFLLSQGFLSYEDFVVPAFFLSLFHYAYVMEKKGSSSHLSSSLKRSHDGRRRHH